MRCKWERPRRQLICMVGNSSIQEMFSYIHMQPDMVLRQGIGWPMRFKWNITWIHLKELEDSFKVWDSTYHSLKHRVTIFRLNLAKVWNYDISSKQVVQQEKCFSFSSQYLQYFLHYFNCQFYLWTRKRLNQKLRERFIL